MGVIMSKKNSDAEHIDFKSNRREFIQQTLKMTAGVYVGMSVIDSFVGPKIGVGGMPLNAATSVRTKPPSDIPPNDIPPNDIPPNDIPPDREPPRDIPPGELRRNRNAKRRRRNR